MKTLYTNITIALLLLTSLSIQAQNIITIDNGPQSTTPLKTIAEAISAAVDGDIIYVQASASTYGAATVDKEVTIIGRSHSEVNNISTLGGVSIKASNVTLKGLNCGGISCSSAAPGSPITNVKVYECKGSFTFGQGYTRTTPTLDGIEIRGCVVGSINQYDDALNVLVSNNIITSNISIYNPTKITIGNNIFRVSSNLSFNNSGAEETAILFNNMFINNYGAQGNITFTSGDWNVSNCLTYNYNATNNFNFTTSGNGTYQANNVLLNTDPLFTNIDATIADSMAGTTAYISAARLEDDLTLQAGSPALTGGNGGSQIGLFNNAFNFKYLGNPRGIPTLDIVSYDGAVAKDGNINVTISAKAN